MRIGMLADVYKPHISGVTHYISLNKKYLEKAGHEVFVFTFGEDDYQDEEENVIRSPGLPILPTGMYFSLRYTRIAQKVLNTMDVVHVHHPFISGSLAIRYCRTKGIPIVFTNHTRYDLYAKMYLPIVAGMLGESALKAYLPSFCRSCQLVISPSNGMREVLFRIGVDSPITVLPNGVDIEQFFNPDKPIDRKEFGYDQDDVILIYMGRMGPEKNLPFLLRSFAGVAQAYENVHLIFIGNGPEKENMVDMTRFIGLQDRVKFTGMIPYDQLPRYMVMGDVFVTASVTEAHPLSLIEAMASGLPVLGIDSPGIGDTIEDGKFGYLVYKEDLAEFTAKMVRLIIDKSARIKMSQEARIAAQQYSIENTTSLLLEQYQNLINRTSTNRRGMRNQLKALIFRKGK